MAYIRIKGIPGRIYVPDDRPTEKKHDCKDCFSCQFCSDTRCRQCRKKPSCKKPKSHPKST